MELEADGSWSGSILDTEYTSLTKLGNGDIRCPLDVGHLAHTLSQLKNRLNLGLICESC